MQGGVRAALSAKIGNEAEFLWEASLKEVERGWAAQPVREAVLDKKLAGAVDALRCVEQAESAEQAEMMRPGETRRHLECKIAHGLPADLRWGRCLLRLSALGAADV